MKNQLAVAMALVVAGLSVGITPAPFAAAQTTVCDLNNFPIPDSEPSDGDARSLLAGTSEVGTETLSATDDDELLHVEMVDAGKNGQLNWSVHYEDDGNCVLLDANNCEDTIRTNDTEQTCTLEAPLLDSREYHVEFEAGNQNQIEYKTWVS